MSQPEPRFASSIGQIGRAVLGLAFILRAVLAWRGGQQFWPEEDLFDASRQAAERLLQGEWLAAAHQILGRPEHLLFQLAGLIPALLETALGAPAWISALMLGTASTWVLWLIPRLTRAAGGSEMEGLVALMLAAGATSLFYHSRHLLPYDLALGLCLLGLLTSLREDTSARASLLTGLWLALGYLAYNGAWPVGAILLATHALWALPQPKAMAIRFAYALLGSALPLLAVAAVSRLFGHDFPALALASTGPSGLGELDQVWLNAAQYFWSAEHGLAVLWGVAFLMALDQTGRPGGRRFLLWTGLAIAFAMLLVVPPEPIQPPVVRHLRVLVPFLCLTTAAVLCSHPRLLARPRLLAGLLVLAGLQAAWNFSPPLRQVFPREFERQADRFLAAYRPTDLGPYKFINATFLHNPTWAPAGPDQGVVLLRRPHPFQFEPYLFEGYSPPVRAQFRERDLSMRVVRLDAGGPPISGYPEGMLELTLRFPMEPKNLLPEPLLSTGEPGRGDTVFIRYEGPDHFAIGHDHTGGGATLASWRPLDRSVSHRVLIGMDTFRRPGPHSGPSRRFVLWDDEILLHGRADLHPTSPGQIVIGQNFIGTSTAVTQLSAEIESFRRIPSPALGAAFAQPPGALRLRLLPPRTPAAGDTEPLLSSGPSGHGDLLFLRCEGQDLFRIGHDHWGAGAVLSEPFRLDPTRPVELVLAMGSFFAPDPNLPGNQRRLYATCNGQVLFNRSAAFHPSTTTELALGENLTGSTAAAPALIAEVIAAAPVAVDSVVPASLAPPGALRLKLRFFGPPAPGQTEPLLSTGRTGAGDLLFIRFDGQGRYQIGHDNWGRSMVLSPPRPFDPSHPLELTISMGSLYPAEPAPDARLARLRNHLLVAAGHDILLNEPAHFHPADARSWVVGLNLIGSSSAGELLSADLLDSSAVPAETILSLLPAP